MSFIDLFLSCVLAAFVMAGSVPLNKGIKDLLLRTQAHYQRSLPWK